MPFNLCAYIYSEALVILRINILCMCKHDNTWLCYVYSDYIDAWKLVAVGYYFAEDSIRSVNLGRIHRAGTPIQVLLLTRIDVVRSHTKATPLY